MKSQQNVVEAQDLEKTVVDYLRNNSDFFEGNLELLAELKVPHSENGAVISLIERQVGVLRDQNQHLKNQLQRLVEIARENDSLNQRLHALTLSVISVDSKEGMVEMLNKVLHDDFAADAVCVHLFDKQQDEDEELVGQWDELSKYLVKNKVKCDELSSEHNELLFGEMAESIGSAALVSLGVHGILAIGSHDNDRFHSEIATDYLEQIGDVITGVLGRIQ